MLIIKDMKVLLLILSFLFFGCQEKLKQQVDKTDNSNESVTSLKDVKSFPYIEEGKEKDNSAFSTKNYGIGKLIINYSDQIYESKEDYTLDFFTDKEDKTTRYQLTLSWNNSGVGFIEAKNADFIKIKDWYINDYHIIHLRCFNEVDGFFEVMTNEETQERMWIKKSATTEFISWSDYLSNVVTINQIDFNTNPARKSPDDTSEILYNDKMEWEVVSVKGNWAEVRFSEIFMDMTKVENQEFRAWIKWRNEKELLVEYGLAI